MKRIVLAGIAALALTTACQTTAFAGGGWGFNASVGVSVSANFNWYCNPCQPACASGNCGYGYPQAYDYYTAPYYAPSSYYSGYAAQQYAAPTTQTLPAPMPQGSAVTTQAAVQPIGYYYYGNYGYNNYGYYQAPSYWYGR